MIPSGLLSCLLLLPPDEARAALCALVPHTAQKGSSASFAMLATGPLLPLIGLQLRHGTLMEFLVLPLGLPGSASRPFPYGLMNHMVVFRAIALLYKLMVLIVARLPWHMLRLLSWTLDLLYRDVESSVASAHSE